MRPLDPLHELIEWEIVAAYHDGYRAALADIAVAHAALDEAWRPIGRRRHHERVAERIAEMEQHARGLRAELDRRAGRRGRTDPAWPTVAVPGQPRPAPRRPVRRAA